MAPLVKACEASINLESRVCVTAQHREMLDQVLDLFEIVPDYDLDLMTPGQTLNAVTSAILLNLKSILEEYRPDLVLVHGDTATTFAAALAAFYEKIYVGHVEAGLRTGDIYSPWPEELNRKLTSNIAKFHFAPTLSSRNNLIREGIDPESIYITGNTVIDALLEVSNKISSNFDLQHNLENKYSKLNFSKKLILVTAHRRENFGAGFEKISEALLRLAKLRSDIQIIFPVHMNPDVRVPVTKILGNINNITLIDPVEYVDFVFLMMKSYIIVTDSGGIQEEAPSLGKPVLLMRDSTERPEAIDAGTVHLVGNETANIVNSINNILDDHSLYTSISKKENPYGHGEASQTIVNILSQILE